MAERTQKPAYYTVEQLMELVSTGSCATSTPGEDDKVCADPTKAALADPAKIKLPGTKRIRFKVQNQSADPKFFGFGESLSRPGLSPLYPTSVFAGQEGVNEPAFFVGDNNIALAAGPSSLATQSETQRNPVQMISRIAIVRVDESDPILAEDMQFERVNPANGKCNTEQVSPECNACDGTTNSGLITAAFNMGLAPADHRNALGIIIPGNEGEPEDATMYTIDVDLMFTEGAYGYVAVQGQGLGSC